MTKISPRAKRALGFNRAEVGRFNSSQVTKGKRMFVDLLGDGRSAWAKRWADLIVMHVNDLGGIEMISEAQLSICRRAAALECELESIEARMSASQPIDIELYARLARTLCRLFELIGIRRLSKSIDPLSELAQALNGFAGEPVDENVDEPSPLVPEPGEA